MNLTFKQDYWHDPAAKREFMNFLIHIHRLDLSKWDETGYWDDNFHPFSYFDSDKMVSSLCVYSMDMTINGRRRRAAQISSVGTLVEHRRKGLNQKLTEKAIEWAQRDHDFFFLFADAEALPFYERCGFRRTVEHKPSIAVSGDTARPGARKLDINRPDHLELMYRLAANRQPVSDMLGVHNEKLFMFWCLYYLSDNIHYIADLNTLVLFARKGEVVTIFDVVSDDVPSFDVINPYIGAESDRTVEFMFMPDRMGLDTPVTYTPLSGNLTHLMGDFPFESVNYLFPYTSYA